MLDVEGKCRIGHLHAARRHIGLTVMASKRDVGQACGRALGITGFISKADSNKVILEYCSKHGLKVYSAKRERKNRPPSGRRKKATPSHTFFRSSQWLALRYKVFTKYGRVCMCCGAKPPDVVLHVDHIKPRSLFPELEWDFDNLQVLCEGCNIGKSCTDITDWRPTHPSTGNP